MVSIIYDLVLNKTSKMWLYTPKTSLFRDLMEKEEFSKLGYKHSDNNSNR